MIPSLLTSLLLFFASPGNEAEPLVQQQEVLKPAKIRARSSSRGPRLGLPLRTDGTEEITRLQSGRWLGGAAATPPAVSSSIADSHMADGTMVNVNMASDAMTGTRIHPDNRGWIMWEVSAAQMTTPNPTDSDSSLAPFLAEAARWAAERPTGPVATIIGTLPDGRRFVALCKRVKTPLGWKSIGFLPPSRDGRPNLDATSSTPAVYIYSTSVNRIEHLSGYNLFPRLPSHLQEIIEEMTASELFCSFQEFDSGLNEYPDRSMDTDFETEDHPELFQE